MDQLICSDASKIAGFVNEACLPGIVDDIAYKLESKSVRDRGFTPGINLQYVPSGSSPRGLEESMAIHSDNFGSKTARTVLCFIFFICNVPTLSKSLNLHFHQMLFASLQPLQFKCTHFASAILFNINCNFAITMAAILASLFVCVFVLCKMKLLLLIMQPLCLL